MISGVQTRNVVARVCYLLRYTAVETLLPPYLLLPGLLTLCPHRQLLADVVGMLVYPTFFRVNPARQFEHKVYVKPSSAPVVDGLCRFLVASELVLMAFFFRFFLFFLLLVSFLLVASG